MTDVLKFGKKFFTIGVVITTIIWSLGVALLVPAVASAATCPTLASGDMIKVTGKPAIYAVNNDLKVLYFPSGDEFKSWRPTYGGYISVTQECFDSLSVPSTYPGAVNFHAGSYVVKRPSSDQLYVVEPNNTLAKITAEAATALYGAGYKVMTVADTFWPHYVNRGTDVTEAKAHPGMLVKVAGTTYLVNSDNKLQTVSETGLTANGFQTKFVRTLTDAAIAGFVAGDAVTAEVKALTDKTQSGGVVSVPVTGGALTVSLASDNPAAKNLADGSAYNDVLKLNLTAGSNNVKVTGVSFTKTGLIANSNITGVSVWDKTGYRHGDVMSSLTSENKVTMSFATNPILVAAGTTETLLVRLNISNAANSGLVGFKLAAATDLTSDGTIGGSFPVEGNQMNIVDGNASLASTTIAAQSAGGNTLAADAGNLEIGQTQKEVGKFQFTENSGNEDVVISRLTFYMEGTVQDKDLANFKVYAPDGSVLGSTEKMTDRYVTVNFSNPFTLPKSTNKTLSVKVDVVDGSSRNFRVHIQNDYDVMLKGSTTGFFVLPSGFADAVGGTSWFAMKAGSLTVNKATASPAGNVSSGASSVVLGQFDVKAVGENMEIRKMGLGVDAPLQSVGGKKLTGNVTVRDKASGTVYLTVAASGAAVYGSATQYNLSSYINVNSGETRTLEVLGSVDSTATSGNSYKVGLGNFYAKRMSTLDFADNLPSAVNTSTQGNQLTVNATALTCNKDTSMGNVTRATGATTVVGQYICTAGSSEDVRLTGVTVALGNTGNAANTFQNLSLWDNTTQLGSSLSTVASSSNGFNFDITIAKNTTKVFQVKAFLVSGQTGTVSSSFSSYNYTGKDSGTSNTGSQVVGQSVTVGSASLAVAVVSDATTISKIYGPGQTDVQLGKWKFSATNDKVTLTKITFTTGYSNASGDATALGTYNTLSLYDGAAKLGDANYVSGNVVFTGLSLPVEMDSYKILTLKGTTNSSGVITNNTSTAFAIKSASNTDLEATSGAGGLLAATDINDSAGADLGSRGATSTSYIFHDAYPTVQAVSLGTALTIDSKAPIFKYTITNSGTRDLRLSTTTVAVNVTGLTSNTGATATGTIGGWTLYEDNGAGGLGTKLAVTTTEGLAAAATVAAVTDFADGYKIGSSINVTFGPIDDQNSLFDNFLISPGSSRTFIMTADTTRVFDGKTTGMVTVSGKISGTTGWSGTAWNTGNLTYFYTPVGGIETSGITHSDSYDISGGSLSRSL